MYIIILLIIFQLQSSSLTRKILKMKRSSLGDRNFEGMKINFCEINNLQDLRFRDNLEIV